MSGRRNRFWRWVVLAVLVAACAGANDGKPPPEPVEKAMALLPHVENVKRFALRELWRLDKDQLTWREKIVMPYFCDPITPDGKHFVTSGGAPTEGTIRVHSLETGKVVRTLDLGIPGATGTPTTKNLRFTPDMNKVVCSIEANFGQGRERRLALFDALSSKFVSDFEIPTKFACDSASLTFDREGRRFAIRCLSGEWLIFDVTKTKPVLTFSGGTGDSARFSSDGQTLTTFGWGGPTYWGVADGKQVAAPDDAEEHLPALPEVKDLILHFISVLPGGKSLLYSFYLSAPGHHDYGMCVFDLGGKLTGWAVLPDQAAFEGISPDGRLALSEDTTPAQYGIPEAGPLLTKERIQAMGVRELVPPIRGWAVDLGDK
jgi:hypothetical protein